MYVYIYIYIVYIYITLCNMFRPLKIIIRLKYLLQNIKMIHNRFFVELGSQN
jgi:hypothetical protein